MYKTLQKNISSLAEPTNIKNKTYDELLEENIALAKTILSTSEIEWIPIDSDPYMKKIRVLTLRQLHNQSAFNLGIKASLRTIATGVDLDHLGVGDNVFRDKGEYPYTTFTFTLSNVEKIDKIIPKGFLLNDDTDTYKASTLTQAVIPAGELSTTVQAELQEYVVQSEAKTENLIVDLTFAVDIKQNGLFENGATAEDDDRYRLRIISANSSYTTAGSEEAYKYFAYSADSRIDDISIPNDNEPLEVNIYIASFENEVDTEMIQKVYDACNYKYTRPLGDALTIMNAEVLTVDIVGTIQLLDLMKQSSIDAKIKTNLRDPFFIGQDFVASDFMSRCHIDGVYKVAIDFEEIKATNKQIIKIGNIDLNYIQVVF